MDSKVSYLRLCLVPLSTTHELRVKLTASVLPPRSCPEPTEYHVGRSEPLARTLGDFSVSSASLRFGRSTISARLTLSSVAQLSAAVGRELIPSTLHPPGACRHARRH